MKERKERNIARSWSGFNRRPLRLRENKKKLYAEYNRLLSLLFRAEVWNIKLGIQSYLLKFFQNLVILFQCRTSEILNLLHFGLVEVKSKMVHGRGQVKVTLEGVRESISDDSVWLSTSSKQVAKKPKRSIKWRPLKYWGTWMALEVAEAKMESFRYECFF